MQRERLRDNVDKRIRFGNWGSNRADGMHNVADFAVGPIRR
jgi:hypothetical protein